MSNRCNAKTKSGARCKNGANGNGRCASHGEREPYKLDALKRASYLEKLARGSGRGAAAGSIGIHRSTVADYRRAHPDFAAEESAAEMGAVSDVEDALYANARKGHVTAIIFFLKNRSPENWKDMKTVEVVDQLRAQERGALFRALDAAGLTDEQVEAFQQAYESGDVASVVH